MKFLLLAAMFLAVTGNVPGRAGELQLVTPEEAARPDASSRHLRGLFPGPTIKMVLPGEDGAAQPLKSPFRLKLEFTARNGSKVDVATTKMIYLKTPTADITARIQSSITAEGIDVANAALPPGRHNFYISVVDSSGNRGVAIYTLTVAK